MNEEGHDLMMINGGMVTEVQFLPDGMEPDDINSHVFQVIVRYRGNGKYAVATSSKWLLMPLKMTQMRHCRFTFDEAIRLAKSAVNNRRVNGHTWTEWQESKNNEG